MRLNKASDVIGTFFMITLFSIFALSSLMLVVVGSKVYKSITTSIETNNQTRASINYIAYKLRESGNIEDVGVSKVEGADALTIKTQINSEAYKTYIYYYNGSLYECFLKENTVPTLNDGTALVKVNGFFVEKKDNMLNISIVDNSEKTIRQSIYLEGELKKNNSRWMQYLQGEQN